MAFRILCAERCKKLPSSSPSPPLSPLVVMPLVLSRAESRNYPGLWGALKGGPFYMTTTHKGGEQTRREEGRVKTRISTNSRTTDKFYGKRGDEGYMNLLIL